MIVFSNCTNLVLQDIFQLLFFVEYICVWRWHQITNTIAGSECFNVTWRHPFPHVFIFEVPTSVHYSIICLNVCKESLVVKHTANCPIESMDSRILWVHLLSGQTFPKVTFLFSLRCNWLACEYPRMGALTVGSDDGVCIQAKTKQQIAQQNSMVFAVTTTLNIVIN